MPRGGSWSDCSMVFRKVWVTLPRDNCYGGYCYWPNTKEQLQLLRLKIYMIAAMGQLLWEKLLWGMLLLENCYGDSYYGLDCYGDNHY